MTRREAVVLLGGMTAGWAIAQSMYMLAIHRAGICVDVTLPAERPLLPDTVTLQQSTT